MRLQKPGSFKSPELQPLLCGLFFLSLFLFLSFFLSFFLYGSGDMGLNEGARKTSIVCISKIMFVQRGVVG